MSDQVPEPFGAGSARRRQGRRFHWFGWIFTAVVVIVALAAGGSYVAGTNRSWPRWLTGGPSRATARHIVSDSRPAPTTTTTAPPPPLSVDSISPGDGTTGVSLTSTIEIHFSAPVAIGSAMPTLSPATAGTWKFDDNTLIFTPQTGFFQPYEKVTVTLPAGMVDTAGGHLLASHSASFTVGAGSVLRLQQLLAQLGYLPFNAGSLSSEPAQPQLISPLPSSTPLTWKYPNIPGLLSSQWVAGKSNVLTEGAVMAFESDHGLATDGVAGPEVWSALEQAVAARHVDPRAYNYIMVTEQSSNETLSVWQAGRIVYTSPANTGVAGAATQEGTFPVTTHDRWNLMTGTDVDGTHYSVEVPYAAYFYGGDAIHGYPRASYGWPQSNGCVELPIQNAGYLFNSGLDWYGTLVTVYTP